MLRVWLIGLFIFLFDFSHADEKPDVLTERDTLQVYSSHNLPDLYKVIKSPVLLENPNEIKGNNLQIPAIKQGFFCRFEDRLQIKRKIPLNFGTD